MTFISTPIDKSLELPTRTKHFQPETKSITVFDSGDPSVGIPATEFTIGDNFYFDEPEHLEDFKRDLMKLLAEHDQTQGRTSALADWELEAMQMEAKEDFTMDYSKDFEEEIMCSDCGSDNLAYIEQYANGCEYQCRDCDKVSIY